MSKLRTHPRLGFAPTISFDVNDGGAGGGGDKPAEKKDESKPDGSESTPAQGGKETDWKAEARKWETRAKENKDAADTAKALQDRLEKLAPLEKLADALGTGDGTKGPTEVQQLAERVTKHEEELQKERAARYRAEVAHEKGLNPAQAARLVGSTKEELAADADALLEAFPAPEKPKNPLVISQSGGGAGEPRTGSLQAGRDLFKAELAKRRPAPEMQNN